MHPQKMGPLNVYQRDLGKGALQEDPLQYRVVLALEQLWRKIQHNQDTAQSPLPTKKKGLLSSLMRKVTAQPAAQPRRLSQSQGLYIVGPVGRGKTMLMDLFYTTLTSTKARREHFVDFMRNVHKIIHQLRQQAGQDKQRPIEQLARDLTTQRKIFCLDEFQIEDIADAMILGHLFKALFARGAILVTTSNTPISALFQGRPGADSFKPFIQILQENLKEVRLDSPQDYRRKNAPFKETWLQEDTPHAEEIFKELFSFYSGDAPIRSQTISCQGHHFTVSRAAGDACMVDFDELCDRALGATDYSELAQRFGVIFLDNVPKLGPQQAHIARRFILLVDVLYDHKNLLFVRSAVDTKGLFTQGEGVELYTRTFSRLNEMGSRAWLARYGRQPTMLDNPQEKRV